MGGCYNIVKRDIKFILKGFSMKRKFVSLFIVLCFVISTFPVSLTASANSYDIFCYYIADNEVCITLTNTFPIGDVVIPDEIEGFPVTAIQWEAFSGCNEMTSIYIPDTVTWIGESAFRNCSQLTSITIPDAVTYIGSNTFWGCTKLEEINLPASLENIYSHAFYNCANLKDIHIPKSVEYIAGDAFDYCANIETITVEEGNEFYYSKDNCLIDWEKSALRIGKNNSIPEDGSVTSLYYTFSGRTDITEIVIPDCITVIYNSTFEGCTELKNVVLPKGLTSISGFTFNRCSSLESIVIPSSVSSIAAKTFYNCESLTDIYCVAKSQPEGWNENWLGNTTATVHWGYIPYGDINGDSEINLTDYTMAKRIVMETYVVAYSNSNPADVNGDGSVTANDYILIKRHVMQTYTLV